MSVEKQMIGELFLTKNTNDIIAFTQTYVSNYIPVLFYAVKHFDTNQIARLMNSSILIDRLLYGRINDAIRLQVHNDVKEFLSNNKLKEESEIVRLINNQTIINKANLSHSILFMFLFMTIEGVNDATIMAIISEIGLEGIKKFKSAKQFTAWLRLAPNNKISGGK
jgi:hypothetical protein